MFFSGLCHPTFRNSGKTSRNSGESSHNSGETFRIRNLSPFRRLRVLLSLSLSGLIPAVFADSGKFMRLRLKFDAFQIPAEISAERVSRYLFITSTQP